MSRVLLCIAALSTLAACEMMPSDRYDHQRSDWNYRSTSRNYNGYDGRGAFHNQSYYSDDKDIHNGDWNGNRDRNQRN